MFIYKNCFVNMGYSHGVDSVIESSLGSKIMHLFIWYETFVGWQ